MDSKETNSVLIPAIATWFQAGWLVPKYMWLVSKFSVY